MTQAQIISASNAVYFDNVSGSITPTAVRNLNTDWINSTVTTDMVSGLTVASSSYAALANTALTATSSQTATNATNALTASFLSGTAASASYSVTSSLPLNGVVSATAVDSTITFTKGDATTFSVTVSQSGSVSTASLALNSELLDGLDSTSFATTSSFNSLSSSLVTNYATKAQVTSSVSVLSGSVQVSQNALSSSLSSRVVSLENFSSSLDATFATDASVTASINVLSGSVQASQFALSSSVSTRFGLAPTLAGNNTFTGNNIFGNITASNAQFNSASIEYLSVIYQTSSVVYSSGSNVFGDAANDTQTLWGTVNMVTGPLNVTGSTRLQQLTSSGLRYPSVDGLEGQVLKTDGTNDLAFGDVNTIFETVYTGESITKGDPLYISGSQGANAIVYKADASNAAKMPVTYIASETIAAGNTTRGIVLGLIEGIDLTGYAAGTEVYVAAGGGWTSVRPTGTNIVQLLGIVTKEGAGGKGLVLNPGPVELPNLTQGNVWLGNASGVPVAVTGSSLFVTNAATASFYGGNVATASYAIQANTAFTATSSLSANTATTASYAVNANNAYAATSSLTSISSSYAATASVLLGSVTSASFATTANSVNALSQSLVITGSFNGLVVSQSIASNTSSLNFGTANFFTSAVTSTTFFNITNPKPGETVNVLLTTVGAATASFSSNVKQPSGSAYTPSAGNAKQDILTFVSFDGTTVYLANVKNLI